MKLYIITRQDYPGQEVELYYHDDGLLACIDFRPMPSLRPKHIQFLKNTIPHLLHDPMAQFTHFINAAKGKLHITERAFDVSFDTFWNLYNYKRHKKDAERLYQKLSYADKVKCIDSIKPYHAYRARKGDWLQQMLPDTYISKREFDTDWNKMK